MNRAAWLMGIVAGAAFLTSSAARGQNNEPRIGYVYPAGGQRGTTLRLTLGGQSVNGVSGVYISGEGISGTVIEHVKPMSVKEGQVLKDKLKELLDKREAALVRRGGKSAPASRPTWTAADEQKLQETRRALSRFVPPQKLTQALRELVVVELTIAPTAAMGQRDLRLQTRSGMTNPLVFCVGAWPERSESSASAQREGRGDRPKAPNQAGDSGITLPVTLNGQIMPGGVDRWRFIARRGQRLVAVCSARALIPYLADAVPGWFQATVGVYDEKGKEIAYDDDFRFSPDPVISFEVPRDGNYFLEVKDAIYRGREDFVYRVSLGEFPFITNIFPLGASVNSPTAVQLRGWNLPVPRLLEPAAAPARLATVGLQRGGMESNRMAFPIGDLPEGVDQEPCDDPAHAQALALPIVINGRIDQPGDRDVFSFQARAGQEIVAEVIARRLGSPVDSILLLSDAAAAPLASNDDHDDKGDGLNTHHADSMIRYKIPADGRYFLTLADVQHKGGSEYGYRLRISESRPDFDLRVVPSAINVRGGATVPLTVFALRRDGYDGPIDLALVGGPKGCVLSGATIPQGQDKVRITLTAPRTATKGAIGLKIVGRATAGGRYLERPAVPADDVMQAFIYRHLVPARELLLSVLGGWTSKPIAQPISAQPVRIPVDGSATIRLAGAGQSDSGSLHLELSEPPEGLSIAKCTIRDGGMELTLQCDPAKAKPDVRGNLIINVFKESAPAPARPAPATAPTTAPGTAPPTTAPIKPPPSPKRSFIGTLPAMAFEIVK